MSTPSEVPEVPEVPEAATPAEDPVIVVLDHPDGTRTEVTKSFIEAMNRATPMFT